MVEPQRVYSLDRVEERTLGHERLYAQRTVLADVTCGHSHRQALVILAQIGHGAFEQAAGR